LEYKTRIVSVPTGRKGKLPSNKGGKVTHF